MSKKCAISPAIQLRRRMRLYQAKHRKSKRSYLTQYEDALIVLAWVVGELSEGQAAKALAVDRLTVRERRDSLIAAGLRIGGELWQANR